jgi:hypothetical protein
LSNACTNDTCDPATGCVHTPINGCGSPIDVGGDRVLCNTIIKGVAGFVPPLSATGALPGTTKVKGALGDCHDFDNPNVHFLEGKSSFSGVLTGATNNCAGLSGASAATGTITIKWKTVEKLVNAVSVMTLPPASTFSGIFIGPWGSLYGQFDIGAPTALPVSVSGAFTGGDGGAQSHTTAVTTQSISSIGVMCIKGMKALNLGVGYIELQ